MDVLLSIPFPSIKRPQLIGICIGVGVFVVSLIVVLYLLIASGTLEGAIKELQNGGSEKKKGDRDLEEYSKLLSDQDPRPVLLDSILKASENISMRPRFPEEIRIEGSSCVLLRVLNDKHDTDYQDLVNASNGSAIFHEPEYNVQRIWKWITLESPSVNEIQGNCDSNKQRDSAYTYSSVRDDEKPYSSLNSFKKWFAVPPQNGLHIAIIDRLSNKAIGMVSLVDNSRHLTLRIDNLWLSPSFQSASCGVDRDGHARNLIAKEVIFHVMLYYFGANYRRIEMYADSRNLILNKFLRGSGFSMESTMRKHRIVEDRNRDTNVWPVVRVTMAQ